MTNDSDEAHSERERSCKGAAIAGVTVTVTAEKLADEAFGNQPRNAPDDAELARATRVLP